MTKATKLSLFISILVVIAVLIYIFWDKIKLTLSKLNLPKTTPEDAIKDPAKPVVTEEPENGERTFYLLYLVSFFGGVSPEYYYALKQKTLFLKQWVGAIKNTADSFYFEDTWYVTETGQPSPVQRVSHDGREKIWYGSKEKCPPGMLCNKVISS